LPERILAKYPHILIQGIRQFCYIPNEAQS
jgi:hypothetical protein